MYRSVTLTLHLSADIEVLREKFLEVAKEEDDVIEHHKLLCYVTEQSGTAQTVTCYLMTTDPMSGWTAKMHVREKLLAFIRDHHRLVAKRSGGHQPSGYCSRRKSQGQALR